jgi:hypothetical protein
MSDLDDDELSRLKELAASVDPLILWALKAFADKVISPKRIGVFGAYAQGGQEVIHGVAKEISGLGYTAVTGRGYYLPYKPDDVHPISDFVPPIVRTFLESLARARVLTYDYIFCDLLPRVCSKVAINLGIPTGGGQLIEWQSSVQSHIPVLGFVIRDEIAREPLENCDHLSLKGKFAECLAPASSYCQRQRFCPFLTSPTNLSTVIASVSINRKDHMLAAVKQWKDLTPALKKFLPDSYTKNNAVVM